MKISSQLISVGLLFLCFSARADVLNGGLEVGTSIAHFYDSRSIFTNPAALGYQTDLNDAGLLSSVEYGFNRTLADEFALAASWGYFGLGFEHLTAVSANQFNRASLGVGFPLLPNLYLGSRFSFTSSDLPALNGIDSLDFGLQYHPLSFLALGLEVNRLNEPTISGVSVSPQYAAGVILRPLSRLDLTFDTDTQSDFKKYGYQATAGVEVFRGLRASAGYSQAYQWQFGLQLNLLEASLFSTYQPTPDLKRMVSGVSFSPLPNHSFLEPKTILQYTLDSSLDEQGSPGNLFLSSKPSLLEILKTLKAAEDDVSVKGIILKIESFHLGLSAAQDIQEELLRLRAKGKEIDVFLANAGTKEYFIASAATKIHMEPGGELRILGSRSERFFIKGTMDKLGVEGEFLARGEYKSAPEMFTRKGASPASREATMDELTQIQSAVVAGLAKTRGFTQKDWDRFTQHAIFSARDAKDFHLIDAIDHASEETEKIQSGRLVKSDLEERSDSLSLPSRIAVIVAEGDIMDSKVRALSIAGEPQVTPRKLERAFQNALEDSRTKAIVLRVNSPGGEVLASDEIASMVEKAEKTKPVIVSMGDVAASGGYMISAPADRIFAQPLTVTGSIGVFLGKFNLAEFYKKIDLNKEITSPSPYAAIYSEAKAWTPEEKAIMTRRLNQYYDSFVGYVGAHRHLSTEDAEKAAKGRAWMGNEARDLKIVDQRGGLLEAIAFAAKRSHLAEGSYEPWLITQSLGLFQIFGEESWLAKAATPSLSEATLGIISPEALHEIRWMARLAENPFLYWAPVGKVE